MKVAVVNGPNLNLLGTRQPEIYGKETLADLETQISDWGDSLEIETIFVQSNDESALVESIQESANQCDAIILNAGGFTHTSVAIADAVASVDVPTIEVHLSDISSRESFRQSSLIAPVAEFQITGRGSLGYRDALRHLVNRTAWSFETVSYGPHVDNIADVRLPETKSKATVILVHGGFWLNPWKRDSLESGAIDLSRNGYTTVNLEYRRTPEWPASGHDVLTAIRNFRRSGTGLALLGHSAGGYLSLWSQARSPVDLLIGLAPVTDLERAQTETPSARTLLSCGAPSTVGVAGTNGLLVHGGYDSLVDPHHSTRLEGEIDVEVIPDLGHFEMLDPSRSHWGRVLGALDRTFD